MNAATMPPQVAARPALLEIDDLRAAYGGSQVLLGIGLRIGSGDVATLLGRNGMGKTTTVRALLGLLPPSAGTVRFLGERIDGLAPDRIAVSAIAPGAFASDMNRTARDHADAVTPRIPGGRIGRPEDMAGAAIYLASRAGDYVMGTTLTVDGGSSLVRPA